MAQTSQDKDGPEDWAKATEQRLLDEALVLVPNLGFSAMTLAAAGRAIDLTQPEVDLLLPGGPQDLAALLSRRHDAVALAGLPDSAGLKIRERIRAGVVARLDAAAADREAVRRWAGFLALPMNLGLAGRLIWESADGLWRWAGDTATDENHYSKRAILAGILLSCLALDLGPGREAALANLDARIENVMAFEKWKAGLKPADFAKDVAGALARIRFGRA